MFDDFKFSLHPYESERVGVSRTPYLCLDIQRTRPVKFIVKIQAGASPKAGNSIRYDQNDSMPEPSTIGFMEGKMSIKKMSRGSELR